MFDIMQRIEKYKARSMTLHLTEHNEITFSNRDECASMTHFAIF